MVVSQQYNIDLNSNLVSIMLRSWVRKLAHANAPAPSNVRVHVRQKEIRKQNAQNSKPSIFAYVSDNFKRFKKCPRVRVSARVFAFVLHADRIS